MLTSPNYSFEANTSDYPLRFQLLFSETAHNNDNTNNITGGTTEILDMTGRVVATEPNTKLAPGVYIVRTTNGNEIKTEKIIIK